MCANICIKCVCECVTSHVYVYVYLYANGQGYRQLLCLLLSLPLVIKFAPALALVTIDDEYLLENLGNRSMSAQMETGRRCLRCHQNF